MASVNKAIIIGNLGKDPELKSTPNGQSVCTFNIATNERWTGKDGEAQERTEWHRIVLWGKNAENAAKYLKKGRPVYIEGRLQTRSWEDKESGVTRYVTEIVGQVMQFLGAPTGSGRPDAQPGYVAPGFDESQAAQNATDEDIPF